MYGVIPEWVNLNDRVAREEVEVFLEGFDLILDQDVDYTIVIRGGPSKGSSIIATCSKAKNVLKCFAVSEELQGEGIASSLVSALLDKLFNQGVYHSFIFTKPANARFFSALNFKLIHSNADVALLESGIYDIGKALQKMKTSYHLGDGEKASLVMNCNPFTLGHRYLIEEAAKNNNEVLVFIVEEDLSLFPFKTRYELVRQGVSDLENVIVVPSGEYLISSATFPSYFIKEEGKRLRAYVNLDASIFGRYFCEFFNITKRYVGEEPYCQVTNAYNEALKKVLPTYGVELHQIARKTFRDVAISASRVRSIIKGRDDQELKDLEGLLPDVTLKFLNTSLGRGIVD
ncbi:[citrate (pro-3S)-lyase] ligase [Desulfosporosinus sp. Sb-LF]|uniref:[citrate (pro-3S)-lyase] ligase n=1 Tax=Desulfosporosinus sp. Sb-LF TaxID=2560027 RepID=UPI00107FBA74|nr:[citrate (pro-3S)-lyase] ligase [Desulfosporosinus sp. Sb-LF]TGE31976.1 [citrate (pro-3S)-lyase] ligase [Desulfosporosinus sp. Sb-LF]